MTTSAPPRTPARPPTIDHGRARRLALPAATAVVGLAGASYLHAVDPNEAGHYPGCPFLGLTGWYCPGCGSARALHALTDGDLGTAFARNPIVPFCVAYLLVVFAAWSWRAWSGRPRTRLAPAWVLHVLWIGLTLFWVLRNLPGWTWLSPA